jgi:peptidoglycan/LPS O-acetylase OafA/YrhL
MDAIAFGCLTAMLVSRIRFSSRMLNILTIGGLSILLLVLGFSHGAYTKWLYISGLDMTILAIGTCMIIAAAAQTNWRCPCILKPLSILGQLSYEVYLTHMFVVYALFNLFVSLGKPIGGVPVLFAAVILIAAMLGAVVSRFFSNPMNSFLRNRYQTIYQQGRTNLVHG